MPEHADILEQQDSLRGTFAQSLRLHAAIAGLLVVSSISYQRSFQSWGDVNTKAGDAVPVTAVKTIPLPSRAGLVNPVANDTESQVPQPPKPQPKKAMREPEPKAIP